MKVSLLASFVLISAITIFAIFFAGREINTKIEESIKTNYQSEINLLKEKLNNQSELINSIIDLNNKNNSDSDSNINEPTLIDQPEFVYIKENGGITITGYNGSKTSVNIPNKIEQLPVLKIAENAFSDSKIKSITLPSTCKEIDWFAFYGCYALTTIYISSNVSIIGYGAFDGCSKSLTIYCENNSFAERYAQSFGISYSHFQ